jgi:oligoribonuclease NrnB/cAMP/cGMP phosphodiesterase (DHH superfamily)
LDLKQVKKAVVHDNCMDGLASALLIQEALPDVELVFCQYGKQQEELECEPGMLFCDFTPHRSRVQEYVAAGAIVLDHHVHARDIVEAFGENGRFGRNEAGESGAMLAYEHVLKPMLGHDPSTDDGACELAVLASVRDTWLKESPNWESALELHAILEAFPRTYWLGNPKTFQPALSLLATGFGKQLRAERVREVAALAKTGLVLRVSKHGQLWALACAPHALVSDLGEAARERGIVVLVNVALTVEQGRLKYRVGLRSDGSVDVGAIAKRYGGGGHRNAAGFETMLLREGEHPLHVLAWLSDHAVEPVNL